MVHQNSGTPGLGDIAGLPGQRRYEVTHDTHPGEVGVSVTDDADFVSRVGIAAAADRSR